MILLAATHPICKKRDGQPTSTQRIFCVPYAIQVDLVAVTAMSCKIFRDDIMSCSSHGGAVGYVVGSAAVMAALLNSYSRKVAYAMRNAVVIAGPLMFC